MFLTLHKLTRCNLSIVKQSSCEVLRILHSQTPSVKNDFLWVFRHLMRAWVVDSVSRAEPQRRRGAEIFLKRVDSYKLSMMIVNKPTSPTGLLILALGNRGNNNRRLKVCINHGRPCSVAYEAELQPAIWWRGRPRAGARRAVWP